jgi:hypothetical protein
MKIATKLTDSYSLKSRHLIGLPSDLSGEEQKFLPKAEVLLIEEKRDGTFLYRYTSIGDFCGDTWHRNIEDAKHQVEFEFGDQDYNWVDIPESLGKFEEIVKMLDDK